MKDHKGTSQGEAVFPAGKSPAATPLSDLVRPTSATVTPRTPLSLCIEAIVSDRCRDLYVTDSDGHYLGVITPFDILTHIGPGMGVQSRKRSHHLGTLLSPNDLCAEDVMSRGHIAVRQDVTLSEALAMMEKHHHPDLVVVDPDGVLVGIVDICSILSYLGWGGGS
ncbi:MAG: CBS domain-containing protein [Methanolinea sp.]|nr:CBS domain-containing protein [Methanolinea sp.]